MDLKDHQWEAIKQLYQEKPVFRTGMEGASSARSARTEETIVEFAL